MNKLVAVLATASALLGFPTLAAADHCHGSHTNRLAAHAPASPAAQKAAPEAGLALKQAACPVSGKPAKDGIRLAHKGQEIRFCCHECVPKFKASPEKYLPAVYRQLYPQTVQIRCPVMGGTVDPKVYTDYKGQRVYFCCAGCDKKLKADPAKYLPKLMDASTEQVHCPVSGRLINPEHELHHAGQDVYFCSSECVTRFKAAPSRYAATLTPEVGILARGATAKDDLVLCPLCLPDAHRRSQVQTLVHEGKVYFVCSPSCADEFKTAPVKHIQELQAAMKAHASPKAAEGKADAPGHGASHGPSPADTEPMGHKH